jgi:hypothetical protein
MCPLTQGYLFMCYLLKAFFYTHHDIPGISNYLLHRHNYLRNGVDTTFWDKLQSTTVLIQTSVRVANFNFYIAVLLLYKIVSSIIQDNSYF